MEEAYTAEVEKRELNRSAELLAQISQENRSAVMELMSISYRAGVKTGESKAAWAL